VLVGRFFPWCDNGDAFSYLLSRVNTPELVLLILGLSVGIIAVLPKVGFEGGWYRVFGKGELSELAAGLLYLGLLLADSIGILALVGEIAGG